MIPHRVFSSILTRAFLLILDKFGLRKNEEYPTGLEIEPSRAGVPCRALKKGKNGSEHKKNFFMSVIE